jgi:hypothetical protein
MATQAIRFTAATAAILFAMMFTSTAAYAQCGCMSGGGDAPKVTSGSASTTPSAINLVRDPTWQAHESTWQGARYMQIYNTTNGVRVAALQIDATGWVIQTDSQSPVTGRTIYRDNEVEVIHYRQSNQDRWIVRPAE